MAYLGLGVWLVEDLKVDEAERLRSSDPVPFKLADAAATVLLGASTDGL